jgi:hypothetical protein
MTVGIKGIERTPFSIEKVIFPITNIHDTLKVNIGQILRTKNKDQPDGWSSPF